VSDETNFPIYFLNRSLKDMSDGTPNKDADSVPIKYNFNSYKYRCNEFNNQEILILGCSQTEGHGLPLELTWPYLISKKMNKDYINLAKGGDGAQAQITKAFQFFKEFYNPKYIFAVFPITRLEVPGIGMSTENGMDKQIQKGLLSNKLIQKFSKFPHTAEHVLPEEFAIFYNILFIKMLIQYCKTNDIKLIWTHYNDSSLNYYSFKDFDSGYFESEYLDQFSTMHYKDGSVRDCHLEFSDNEFFQFAADYDYWPPGHWGLHRQIHIAESIYSML
jgi:hypothetical protein